jgi:hypothetical protein
VIQSCFEVVQSSDPFSKTQLSQLHPSNYNDLSIHRSNDALFLDSSSPLSQSDTSHRRWLEHVRPILREVCSLNL